MNSKLIIRSVDVWTYFIHCLRHVVIPKQEIIICGSKSLLRGRLRRKAVVKK